MIAGQHHYRCATTPQIAILHCKCRSEFFSKNVGLCGYETKNFFLALFKIFKKISGLFRLKTHFFSHESNKHFNYTFQLNFSHTDWYIQFWYNSQYKRYLWAIVLSSLKFPSHLFCGCHIYYATCPTSASVCQFVIAVDLVSEVVAVVVAIAQFASGHTSSCVVCWKDISRTQSTVEWGRVTGLRGRRTNEAWKSKPNCSNFSQKKKRFFLFSTFLNSQKHM